MTSFFRFNLKFILFYLLCIISDYFCIYFCRKFIDMDKVLFSSKSDLWSTPQDLFDRLNNEFHFDLDVCAIPENAKCDLFYSPVVDGLYQPWFGRVWCNPPYGKNLYLWVKKAATCCADVVVMLLPVRTDTKWFHDFIYNKAEIRFIKGRLKFGSSNNSAPFPSMIVIFKF